MDNLFNYHKGSHVSWKCVCTCDCFDQFSLALLDYLYVDLSSPSHNRRFYHFESALPLDKIVAGMKAIMQKTGMAAVESETPNGMVFHVKRKGQHSGLYVDIFMVLKNLHIVEIRRGKGDAIAYYKFMAEIGPLISKEIGIVNQGPSGIVVADATAADAPALPPSV